MQATKPVRYGVLAMVVAAALGMFWFGLDRYWAEQAAVAHAAESDALLQRMAPAPVPPVEPAAPVQVHSAVEAPQPKLVVHVAGAVVRPGVYRFEPGARINDAVEAAGGALPDGMPDALNLAATLSDGDKVFVPTVQEARTQAEAPPAAAGATQVPVASVSGGAGSARSAAVPKGGKVNINTASISELQAVSGIGPATAKAIVEHRAKYGPFRSLESLVDVPGIGAKTLEKLRPSLTL